MKIKKYLVHGLIGLKLNFVHTLSLDAQGILTRMVNLPECDYITLKEFQKRFPKDSLNATQKGLDELVKNQYVLKSNDGIYSVNKVAIVQNMFWIEPNLTDVNHTNK